MSNRVLIVSAVPEDLLALERALAQTRDGPFEILRATSLGSALHGIATGPPDAILVDLQLPDSAGLATFDRLRAAAPYIPVMTLCTLEDESDAMEAVRRGAQGWLSKGYFDNYLVPQALRNIIERVKVERGLFEALARSDLILNSIGDAVVSTDVGGRIDFMNTAAEVVTGWPRALASGRPIDEVLLVVDGITDHPQVLPIEAILAGASTTGLEADALLLDRAGRRVPIEDSVAPVRGWDGAIAGAVMVFRDISNTVRLTSRLRHLAQHDYLTNLPNRLLLTDRIRQALTRAARSDATPVLLFLDLDKFKHVNDSLGHAIGDQLLQAVAARLVQCVRTADTVSRHGGDEFVILLADHHHPSDAATVAEKVLAALARPFNLENTTVHSSTSIGISVFPLDGRDAETLIKHADTAMYHAKERGRNNYQFFRPDMNARASERQRVEGQLRQALEHAEFLLQYQPKYELENGRITGVEALLRWNHPDWGPVLPERFIHVAEECGLIIPIGRWVLREACVQSVRWRAAGLPAVSIAVNVSALEFRQRAFFEQAVAIFDETGADPACLQLELTESVLMHDVAASAELLAKLQRVGVHIAVDDFGTGYSSLSYLNQFPIDVLKIDQSFVRAIADGLPPNGVIVSAVIGMGKNLQQRVVAEGVENSLQLAFLKAHHCDEAQGFLLSPPVIASEMQRLLMSDTPL